MATDIVTTNADSGAGSLRAVLAAAAAGDTIVFDPTVFTNATTDDIKLASSLTITKNVNIEGHVGGGSGTANIEIDGQNAVTDLVINAGVSVYLDGLLIENGKGTGAIGQAAAGGIFDSGTLTLNNSVVMGNAATGGNGANGSYTVYGYNGDGTPGQAGGAAAGGIYVARGATLNLVTTSNAFSLNEATGGHGGAGGEGYGYRAGGAGGDGAYATSSGSGSRAATAGAAGPTGLRGYSGGAGGAAGQPGTKGTMYYASTALHDAPSGGGGGGNAFANDGGLGTIQTVAVACYCHGTLILTDRGERSVENLAIGDLVTTASGKHRAVKWIGRRSYAGHFIAGNHLMLPVTIRAGALADNLPHTDLVVSPGHAMLVDGQLVPAWRLVNGVSITQASEVEAVTYIHVELHQHDILLANGAPAESFLDETGFRGQFQNAHEFYSLYPDVPSSAPLQGRLEDGFALQRIQERLAMRAGLMPALEPVGALRGYLDQAGPDRVCGWAQDVDSPEEPVALEISVDGVPVLCVIANGWRADLRGAGCGSGCHAFDISLPVAGVVTVRRVTDGAVLTMTTAAEDSRAA